MPKVLFKQVAWCAVLLTVVLGSFTPLQAAGNEVLMIVLDSSFLAPHEVEYQYRLEEAGYPVTPMTWTDIGAGIDLSPYGLVYWTDHTGNGIVDVYVDDLIAALVQYGVPFMTPSPVFPLAWGLGQSAHPNFEQVEWVDGETDITVIEPHPIFDSLVLPGIPSPVQVYRPVENGMFIGSLADDATLSPGGIRMATVLDAANSTVELAAVEFYPGAPQSFSSPHLPPTAPFIFLGMGDEVPDVDPYTGEPVVGPNDHENFWVMFIAAAEYLTGFPPFPSDITPPQVWSSPVPGLYQESVSLSLDAQDDLDPAPVIHYTTDGSVPGFASPVYTVPVVVTVNTLLRYFAVDSAGNVSEVHDDLYDINHAPQPKALPITTRKNRVGTTRVSPNDPDPGDTHGFSVAHAPLHGTSTVSADGLVTYTPDKGYAGSDALTISVLDGAGGEGAVAIDVAVGNSSSPAREKGMCGDGVDNDFDGLTDCSDPDCRRDRLCR